MYDNHAIVVCNTMESRIDLGIEAEQDMDGKAARHEPFKNDPSTLQAPGAWSFCKPVQYLDS